MIAAVIAALMPQNSALYGIPGASRDDAARALKTLQNSGFSHLAKADIKDCFQSINPDAIYQLPLPKEVIRRALDHRNLTFTKNSMHSPSVRECSGYPRDYHGWRNSSGPKGLIQGSPASSIILAWLLGGIPGGKDVAVLLCFDNLVIAGRTADETHAMMDALAGFFLRCPAGPLELHDIEYFSGEGEPLEFLGYGFDPMKDGPIIGTGPLDKLEKALVKAEEQDCIAPDLFPFGIWTVLRSFLNGFPAAESTDAVLAYYIETSADVVNQRGNQLDAYLHQNLFAPSDSPEGAAISLILKGLKP